RDFQAELFDAGFAWLSGPKAFGGAGLSADHVTALREVRACYLSPDTSVFMIGQQIVAPAIAAFGSDDQKRRWLAGLFRGDAIGCQLFSEPDAGSDLAALRCRAEPDGDGWRVSGQKVWSSGAHLADVGELLVRTEGDPTLRHKGLSMLLVDMHASGVSVRPLRQINGNAHFNEVFFEDVFVPGDALLGPRGGGWAVANASLTSERDIDADDAGLFVQPVERLLELARAMGRHDPITRQELAATITAHRIEGWLPASLEGTAGGVQAVAPSLLKRHASWTIWEIAQRAAGVLGSAITADDGAWGHYCWSDLLLGVQSQRIAGGTDEIQRNIIGERGLGLPRDSRPNQATEGGESS
ncbi:MAG: acyl-CoA dehydrogenase family protein, partial [Actinomycetota bacterium]|nr:acyl-CoA dehydrogenase family protein [Actinomycetota bacterium]